MSRFDLKALAWLVAVAAALTVSFLFPPVVLWLCRIAAAGWGVLIILAWLDARGVKRIGRFMESLFAWMWAAWRWVRNNAARLKFW